MELRTEEEINNRFKELSKRMKRKLTIIFFSFSFLLISTGFSIDQYVGYRLDKSVFEHNCTIEFLDEKIGIYGEDKENRLVEVAMKHCEELADDEVILF